MKPSIYLSRACLMVFLTIIIFSASAQTLKPFSISGDVSKVKIPIKKVMLFYRVARRDFIEDSSDVVNGKYFFKGRIRDGRPATLTAVPVTDSKEQKKSLYGSVYIEPAKMTAVSDTLFSDMIFNGSRGQRDFNQWEKAKPFEDTILSLFCTLYPLTKKYEDGGRTEADSIKLFQAKSLYQTLKKKTVEFNIQYAKEHLNSPIIMEIIASVQPESIQEQLFNQAPTTLQKTQIGEQMAETFAVRPGKQGADFTLPDTSGRPVRLSSLRGKYVLLDFWASWCAPCRRENPYLVKAFDKYSKNFTIMSVSFDYARDRQAWLNAIRKDGLGMWTHVSSLSGFDSEPGRLYGNIDGIPTNFLLDPSGKIIAKNLKGEELERKLEELIR